MTTKRRTDFAARALERRVKVGKAEDQVAQASKAWEAAWAAVAQQDCGPTRDKLDEAREWLARARREHTAALLG